MSFTLPSFNLVCDIRTGNVIVGAPRLSVACNLAWGRRGAMPSMQMSLTTKASGFPGSSTLLLPAGTDIRDSWNSSGEDCVEVPSGSGRFYRVFYVDDIGKGFPNEHRAAVITKRGNALLFWPTPIP